MKTVCIHIKCRKCGGIKARKIGAVLSDICHPRCQGASNDECECKCAAKFHKGANAKQLNALLKKEKISGMTTAQKKNVDRFKAATAEAKKLRAKDAKLTQAQAVKKAFAKLFPKTENIKKPAAKIKTQQKKIIGALPVGFTGKFLGWPFKVLNQMTIYGGVTAQIVEINPPGKVVAELNGRKEDEETAFTLLLKKINNFNTELYTTIKRDVKDNKRFEKAVKDFLGQLNKEVRNFNSGKDRSTKKEKPAIIKYTATVKKLAVVDQIKNILSDNSKRLKAGYALVPGKPRIKTGIAGTIDDGQKRRSEIINRISRINQDISEILDNIPNLTPVQKGRARAIIAIYKKSIANYKKELKTIDTIINENLKLNQ
jgi:hypothetical protein